ncbi:MAG: hypothetical protein ABIN89_05050 [Chitinophagaceae bacterium]
MQITLSLIQPKFPYKGLDGAESYPSIPGDKKFLIIRDLDEGFTLTVKFFSKDAANLEANYSINSNIMLPLKNNYKKFTISLDRAPTNNPNHAVTFELEFE